MKLVFDIDPSGGLHCLQKPGVDLRALGRVSVFRISEIVWNEAVQHWQIDFRAGPYRGAPLTREDYSNSGADPTAIESATDEATLAKNRPTWLSDRISSQTALCFADYQQAVAAEVAVVEAAQARGETWWQASLQFNLTQIKE